MGPAMYLGLIFDPDFSLTVTIGVLGFWGNFKVEDIQSIFVRSHLYKKAMLELIRKHSWWRCYTNRRAIRMDTNTSRILHEVHGRKQWKFNLLIDLQKAYDTVDRDKLFDILYKWCRDDNDRSLVNLMK